MYALRCTSTHLSVPVCGQVSPQLKWNKTGNDLKRHEHVYENRTWPTLHLWCYSDLSSRSLPSFWTTPPTVLNLIYHSVVCFHNPSSISRLAVKALQILLGLQEYPAHRRDVLVSWFVILDLLLPITIHAAGQQPDHHQLTTVEPATTENDSAKIPYLKTYFWRFFLEGHLAILDKVSRCITIIL